ncbi:MAG: PKD domain-containing protein [Candidatus Lokiarchaeota archaeon]|nr:PKD domain-containing protein [Candidatus Lokiarchaeota archaeon]
MSLRKRRFIGELTKNDLAKKLVAGGIIIGLLLAIWLFLPGVIDLIMGGSRGNYETHEPPPGDEGPYDLYEIPYVCPVAIDLPDWLSDPGVMSDPGFQELAEQLMELIRDLFDPENIDVQGDFSGFDPETFDIPLFYIADYGGGVGLPAGYPEYLRQNTYETMAADGTGWSKHSTILLPVGGAYGDFVVWPQPSYREVTFVMDAGQTQTINLRIPVFPYTPKYVDDSMRYVGGVDPIPDDDVLYNDTYEGLEARVYGLPSYPEPTNFTYRVVNDWNMPLARESDYKGGIGPYNSLAPGPNANDTYARFPAYLQIPGVETNSSRDLSPYLGTHPRFAAAYSALSGTFDKATSRTHAILAGIVSYLYANYDVFTTFPERPGDGQDMVEWFLSRPKTTHPNAGGTPYDFATAFAMLARAFDIPTRVATGYYDWDGDGVVTISNVYAWAEAWIPEPNSDDSDWISYEFVPQFNSTEMVEDLFNMTDIIWIDAPADGGVLLAQTGIPLNVRMYSNMTITDVTYSVDGGANQSAFGILVPVPGLAGGYFFNTTFDVASPGAHTIQAFMHTTTDTVPSQVHTFIVNQETGYFVSIDSPANNSYHVSPDFILDYTAVNGSAIIGASFSVYYVNNGTAAIQDAPIPPLPSQAWSFTLEANGTFSLVVTITTELGLFTSQATLGSLIFMHNPSDLFPDAWFYPSVSNIPQYHPLLFVHAGSNGDAPATYQWNFGDGTVNATMENPVHYYSTPGTYNVTLTVTDADGDVDSVTRPFVVTVTPYAAPDPMVTVNATHIQPGESIQFVHTGDPGAPPPTRSWDFGDGFTAGNLTAVVHQYNTIGNYTAVFTITDGNNVTTTCPIFVVVSYDLYPTAQFTVNGTFSPQDIFSGDSILFAHVGSEGNASATYQWNFGDGSPNATGKVVLHLYTSSGSHTVTLTVTDSDGDVAVNRWTGCINVNVINTTLSVDFSPKSVEIFQNITISGNLEYLNGTGIGGQAISLRIEYWLGATLQGYNTTVATTDPGTGLYTASIQVLLSSEFIRVIATFAGTPVLLGSTAQVVG